MHDGGEAFEARAGVDRRLRQRIELAARVAIELHEDQIPDFDVAAAVAGESAIGVALIGGSRTHVVMDFAARAARAGVAHGPEIFLQAGNRDDAILGRADSGPEGGGFAIGFELPGRRNLRAAENREVQFLDGNSVPLLAR